MPAVQPATSTFPVAPPSESLAQDFSAARESGDPRAISALMPRAQGTSLAPQIVESAIVSERKTQPIQNVLDTSNRKGGMASAEGRLAVADGVKSAYESLQPETGFLKGLAQGLMGNKNWRNAATQGVIRPKVVIGRDGSTATAYFAENSDVPTRVVNNQTMQEMPYEEYVANRYGTYSNMESTPGYKADVISVEAAAKDYQENLKSSNEIAAVQGTIADQSKRIYNIFDGLRKTPGTQLSNEDINDLQSKLTYSESINSNVSNAISQLRQANDSTTRKEAIDKLNAVSGSMGMAPIASISADNKITDANGKTFSLSDLTQKMNQFNTSSGRESQFTKNLELIIKSKVYEKLDLSQKTMLMEAMNLQRSNEKLKADYSETFKKNPLFGQSLPYELGQPMAIGMGNAVIDQMNADIAQIYKKTMDEAGRNGAIPQPGAVAAAVAERIKQLGIREQYAPILNELQKVSTAEQQKIAAQPEKKKPEKAPAPKQRSILKSQDESRLDTQNPARAQINKQEVLEKLFGK